MSFFKVILATIFCFGSSSFLMTMEAENRFEAPKNRNYFSPHIKALFLFKNADITSADGQCFLDQDIKNVIVQNSYDLLCYDLLCDEFLKSDRGRLLKDRLSHLNDKNRIMEYKGANIELNDFDIVTMNDQGRKIFFDYITSSSVSANFFDYITSSSVSANEYKQILNLPVRLRCKVGKLCSVNVGGGSLYDEISSSIEPKGIVQAGTTGSVLLTPFCLAGGCFIGLWKGALGSCAGVSAVVGANVGFACGAGVATYMQVKNLHGRLSRGALFKSTKKPLFTIEEQEMFNAAEKSLNKSAMINKRLNIMQRKEAIHLLKNRE